MKVLFYINGFHPGGKERRLTELLKFLQGRGGVEAEIAVMSDEVAYPDVLALGLPVHYLLRKMKKDPGIFLRFLGLCKAVKPTIIHVWDSMTAVYAVPAARVLGIPLINGMIVGAPASVRFPDGSWFRSRMTFPFSDVIVANSRAGLAAYNVPKAKGKFIYNGFDFRRLGTLTDPGAVRSRLGIGEALLVGMVAEFSGRKDYPTYLRAAEEILGHRNDVVFLAIGDGPSRRAAEDGIPHSLKGRIRFLGWQKDVESIINAMDIGVLSTFTEGISNAVMEMMALGKPVVATAGGGTCELVDNNVTGFLVPQKDAGAMAGKITWLLDHRTDACVMGMRGKDRIKDRFGIERMGLEYIALYQSMASRPAGA